MADIKRYDHDVSGDYTAYSYMEERANGDYVEYAEHKTIVDKLQSRIDRLVAEMDEAYSYHPLGG